MPVNSQPSTVSRSICIPFANAAGLSSNPQGRRPRRRATIAVVKLPRKKSQTMSPGFDEYWSIFRTSSVGSLLQFFFLPRWYSRLTNQTSARSLSCCSCATRSGKLPTVSKFRSIRRQPACGWISSCKKPHSALLRESFPSGRSG